MTTEPLTKKERAWLKRLEKLLMNPPTDRIGFYTIGDPDLTAYDQSRNDELSLHMDASDGDFCQSVDKLGAGFGHVKSACPIHSTAG